VIGGGGGKKMAAAMAAIHGKCCPKGLPLVANVRNIAIATSRLLTHLQRLVVLMLNCGVFASG
jgi:hypothetical protein